MFFTRLGKLLAIVTLVFGICFTIVGLSVAADKLMLNEPDLARYFSWLKSPDAMIDKGFQFIFVSCVLGILAEISYAFQDNQSGL